MKNLIILYAAYSTEKELYAFTKKFSCHSAFDRALIWTKEFYEKNNLVILASPESENFIKQSLLEQKICDYTLVCEDNWALNKVLHVMSEKSNSLNSENVILAHGNYAFLDEKLTKTILDVHEKYYAEYTFADGYPVGFAPEIISSGTVGILSALYDEKKLNLEDKFSYESLFNLIKTDINSFEIEIHMAPKDWRLLRFSFTCDNKLNFETSLKLYNLALENKIPFTAEDLSSYAEKNPWIHHSIPAFYNIQLCNDYSSQANYNPYFKYADFEKKELLSLEKFNAILKQIYDFSNSACIGLSAWGDCLALENLENYISMILDYPSFTILIETEGHFYKKELGERIKKILEEKNKINSLDWIIFVDAFTEEKYNLIHQNISCDISDGFTPFTKVLDTVSHLSQLFPNHVYPQFMRMTENEDELESFWRYWHDKTSPSGGNLIIQKYSNYCCALENKKTADLSPLERNVCWHLKRDMIILADGRVPFCRESLFENIQGNVFEEGLDIIWKKRLNVIEEQLKGSYSKKCEVCDEYYTFNF